MSTVLMLEDDAFVADIVSSKLVQAGLQVVVCETALEAEKYMQSNSVQLLVLDLELREGEQGIQFLEKQHGTGQLNETKVVVFSNNDDPDIKKRCFELGAQEFFVKVNTDFAELSEKIAEMLRS